MKLKKHCLFCNELIPIDRDGGFDRYYGCMCAPHGYYRLRGDAYNAIQAFSYEKKRRLLPIISAYIRELDEDGERASLTLDDVEAILDAPSIPMTADQKERRLLRYVYRKSEGPGEPVSLHPLSRFYNIAYASNLQELVYLIERLRESGWVMREGAVLKLTESGWAEAAADSGGGRQKDCCVIAGNDFIGMEWSSVLLPGLEQCGYRSRLLQPSIMRKLDDGLLESLSSCKLLIIDVTDAGPEVYYAAGFAARAGVPIVWTARSDVPGQSNAHLDFIRPIPWESPEELVHLLQQRL
ncbi:hypothetical protein RB620_06525 [Paenibacillus sp. LHD-117]|uniref:hypothetical protein n=1 Tax=Paenibacillus sp. LHD-117 TaxID=3071412 RepID=UPI0027E104DF|nr:hypothetical protein [Paenibacillus sp. LHD-117]MDQ6419091.1 hypothetical protein [Paenibacillus sp. LHD-117]